MSIAGGSVALATILVLWVVAPVWRAWRDLGRELEPKLSKLEVLRTRLEQRDSLLGRRARLVRELGILCTWELEARPVEDATPPAEGEAQSSGRPPHAEQPGATPPRTRLEAELESTIRNSGARVKLISVIKAPRGGVTPRYFRAAAYQLEMDTSTEGLFKMLDALERGARYVRVNSVKVHHEYSNPDALSVTLQVVAYERTGAV